MPEDLVDAWVEEMLALNGVEATALQVGQELVLPPIDGATIPANTGGTTGSSDPAPTVATGGGPTVDPTATNTPVPAAPTSTATTGPATSDATATPTLTATPEATTTQTPSPTNTPATTATPTGTATFNIEESSVAAGSTIHYAGTGFTPNDTITISLAYMGVNVGSEQGTVGPTGSFEGEGEIPVEASQYPGTYTITITDSHGRTASDSITIQ